MSEKSNIISIFEGQEKKKERRGLRKKGGGENSPTSPPLDAHLDPVTGKGKNFRISLPPAHTCCLQVQ